MATKKPTSPKIIDINSPGQTTPSASSRPVVVSNRSVLTNDPMMVDQATKAEGLDSVAPITRQSKTIAPPSEVLEKEVATDEVPEVTPATPPTIAETDTTVENNEDAITEPDSEEAVSVEKSAAAEKLQAAEEVRRQELEELITRGKYTVPINVVQGGHSRLMSTLMVLFGLVVLAVILDILLDAKVLSLSAIPHTHLFQ